MKIGIYLFIILLFWVSQLSAQPATTCEVIIGYKSDSTQDSIRGLELGIAHNGQFIFNWGATAAVVSLDSVHKKAYCIMTDLVPTPSDTFDYRQICIAHIYINTQTCEIKKEIFAQHFLTKPIPELLAEYPTYKKKMRGWKPEKKHPHANHLLRYSYDLTYAVLLGDSLATELLLSLNKDFKFFRTGLDLEELMWNINLAYELVIIEKPQAYRERYFLLSHMWH